MNTSSSLIPVDASVIAGESIPTVNAREFQVFLGSTRDFSTWITARIKKYGFEEGVDYVKRKISEISRSPERGSKGRGGYNLVDYHLTLDMAKELSMVERTAKGREARRYFIECERRLKVVTEGAALPPPPIDLAKLTPSTSRDRSALSTVIKNYAAAMANGRVPNQNDYRTAYKTVSSAFGLDSITHLPKELIADAIAFAQGKIDAIHQGQAKALPAPSPTPAIVQDDTDHAEAIKAHKRAWIPELNEIQSAVWRGQGEVMRVARAVRMLSMKTDGNGVRLIDNMAQAASNMVEQRAEAIKANIEEMFEMAQLAFSAIAANLELKNTRKTLRDIRKALPA